MNMSEPIQPVSGVSSTDQANQDLTNTTYAKSLGLTTPDAVMQYYKQSCDQIVNQIKNDQKHATDASNDLKKSETGQV